MTGLAAEEAHALADAFEASLRATILSFWYPRAIDVRGGYRVGWDARGCPARDERGIVSQARLVYVFARAARAGIRHDEMLVAAEHGASYLRTAMWDGAHDGFVWTLDDRRKVTYGHAFALFGLSELVRAGGSDPARELATWTFDVLDRHARDPDHGGYRECFAPDWTDLGARDRSPIDGRRPRDKLVNTHLHLLEAMVGAHRAGIDQRAGARARELVDLLVHRASRRAGAPLTDVWTRDWRPRPFHREVRYGHLVELAWMLLDAREEFGSAGADTVVERLMAEVEAHGVDPRHGGIWRSGRLRRGVSDRRFESWAQAEAMLAYLWLLRATGDSWCVDRLRTVWAFVQRFVVDHVVGEWHEVLDAAYRGRGPKGGLWKAGYHATRALLDGAALLRALAAPDAQTERRPSTGEPPG